MTIGTVKFFNETKGYGFIAPDGGGTDAFVHISAIENSGMRTLRQDQRVSYELEQDRRGKMAAVNLKDASDTQEQPKRPTTARPNRGAARMIIRSSNLQFFLARAEQARVEAEQATLEHVRDRCRRSEAAWEALAEKAERSERHRADEAKRKEAEALHHASQPALYE